MSYLFISAAISTVPGLFSNTYFFQVSTLTLFRCILPVVGNIKESWIELNSGSIELYNVWMLLPFNGGKISIEKCLWYLKCSVTF